MPSDSQPIGIGNLAGLKRKARSFFDQSATEVPVKSVPQKSAAVEDVAQLAVDVYETGNLLYIVAPLAGIRSEEVQVEVTEDVVTIEGQRRHPLPELATGDLLVQECYFGAFSRSIVLPESVDSKRAKAEFKRNILIIRLPKTDNARTRVLKVKDEE